MLARLLASSLALGLAVPAVFAQAPGSFAVVGDTLASAMMVRVPLTYISLCSSNRSISMADVRRQLG